MLWKRNYLIKKVSSRSTGWSGKVFIPVSEIPRSRDVGNRSDILILSVVNAAISEITSQKPYLGSADGKIYTREMILSELM